MDKNDIPENFYISLTEFLLHAKQQIIAISSEFGLTSMQALTLLLTRAEEPRPMGALCRMYDCDASNITGIIDGLEQKQLVSRRSSPNDRRVKVVHLEKAGAKLKQKLAAKLSGKSGELFNGLTSEEVAHLARLIQKVAKANT